MLKSHHFRLFWHSLNRLLRLTIVASAAMAMLIVMTIILLRYWLLPDIERYHDKITASLSSAIGSPVTIGKIEGDWQGLRPRLDFTDVRILDERRQPALVLPHISNVMSWSSLVTAKLRLASLEIDRPELLIRRDVQGKIYIGGIRLSQQGSNNDLADWLLHQPRMVARNALITWLDEQRGAPPLVLSNVDLRIDNFFSHHRFSLRAAPPAELASPLDVRGDFHGASFDHLDAWRGQLYARLDRTDVTAWRPWLNLPDEFSHGRGALRGWLTVHNGKAAQAIVDFDLRDVVTRLGEETPELVVLGLRGRAAWKDVAGGMEVSTRHLSMKLQNGVEFQPTDAYFRTARASEKQPASSELRVNSLQLENLAVLANFLPLDAGLHKRLNAHAPSGKVSNLDVQWQGALDKPDSYNIKGQFENFALRQVGQMPGFSGLSVDVDGSDKSGTLNVKSRELAVNAPGAMREPLSFATVTGQASWRHERGEWSVKVDHAAVANDDLAGNLHGSYQTRAGTLGVLDLTASLTRGDVRRAARYTPLAALDREGNDWLNDALLAGHTQDLRIRIKGNLSDFPPGGSKDVLFEIGGHAQDVVLDFDKSWPRIENISGEWLIRGNKLEVKSPSATMLGAHLKNVSVTLPDMMSEELPLELKGTAVAPSNTFLQFIQQSPVRGYIDGFTDGMTASGNGSLDLAARILLLSDKPAKVSGAFRVQDNDIDLGEGVPLLRKARGALSFTESGMSASGIQAEILGGPASINIQTAAGGKVHATVQGRNNIDIFRKMSPHPLFDYLQGGTAWRADINVIKKSTQAVISSNLLGISSTLPPPFAKRANEEMPLRVEKKPVLSLPNGPVLSRAEGSSAKNQDVINVQLGKLLNARLARRDEKGVMTVKRGIIHFGNKAPDAQDVKSTDGLQQDSDGIWLTGNLPLLSLRGWGDLLGAAGDAKNEFPVVGAKLVIGKVNGFGMQIDDLHIHGRKRGNGISAQLSGSTLNGEIDWQPRGEGKLSMRLQNLLWRGEDRTAAVSGQTAKPAPVSPDTLPELQIAIEDFQMKNKQIGRLELVGHPDGEDWRMRRLRITNPDGTLTGDGIWQHGKENTRSSVNLLLEISDAGKMLARSGYPNTVKDGNGKLAANLSWAGPPDEFNYATLDGTLKLDTGKGRFLKMEPGFGKLLSILSLQALPKRIALDFTDVFSEGFQFDNINGNASIRRGVMDTQDFHIEGSSAKVTMTGSVDLVRETQDLRVKVLPTLGDSVSLLGAFTAGPLVGIGSLIINKVLGNPLDKLVSFEYNVSGSWSDPSIVKLGQAASTGSGQAPANQTEHDQ